MTEDSQSHPLGVLKKKLRFFVLCGFWLALFISTHLPSDKIIDLPNNSDKLAHFSGYAILAFLLGFWFCRKKPFDLKMASTVFGILFFYAIIDELLQIPVDRSCDFLDMLADWIGGIIGLCCLWSLFLLKRRTLASDR